MLNELRAQARAAAKKKTGTTPTPDTARHAPALTVAEWCREVGAERHSIMQKLSAAGFLPVGEAKGKAAGAKLYRIGDLYRAMGGGEYETERLRKTREEADKLALWNARARGELVEIAAVKRLGENVMAGIRTRILAFPLSDDEKDKLLLDLKALGDMDWTRNK
jgi:hypothetical protein